MTRELVNIYLPHWTRYAASAAGGALVGLGAVIITTALRTFDRVEESDR